jgi:amino acid transporter
METQLITFSYDVFYVSLLCASLGITAILIGSRIGTQRLALPIIARKGALDSLDEDTLYHLKAEYFKQQRDWKIVFFSALGSALMAGALYLAYQYYSDTPHHLVTFLLALFLVIFSTGVASSGYQYGARIGMAQSFKYASAKQLIQLHRRLSARPLPTDITHMVEKMPKQKCFIHLMVVDYAINNALKGVQRGNV